MPKLQYQKYSVINNQVKFNAISDGKTRTNDLGYRINEISKFEAVTLKYINGFGIFCVLKINSHTFD